MSDPNRCCEREFCRTTLDLWREQDRLLQDIAGELGVEQPDQILPALAEKARIESAAFHAVMQYNSGTEESTRQAIQELDGLFQGQDAEEPQTPLSGTRIARDESAARKSDTTYLQSVRSEHFSAAHDVRSLLYDMLATIPGDEGRAFVQAYLDRLPESVRSEQEKNTDYGAALLPADPISEVTTETLPERDWRRFCVNHEGFSGSSYDCPICGPRLREEAHG